MPFPDTSISDSDTYSSEIPCNSCYVVSIVSSQLHGHTRKEQAIRMDQPNLNEVILHYQNYVVRPWKPEDRDKAVAIVETCLAEYGVSVERDYAGFRDVVDVEEHYWKNKTGELWVCEELETGVIVGTGGYCEIERESNVVEIKKMYLSRHARGKGLGRAVLETLERRIKEKGYCEIHIQTATFLKEACKLYQSAGYRKAGSEIPWIQECDLLLKKSVTQVD